MTFETLPFVSRGYVFESGHWVEFGHVIHPDGCRQPVINIYEKHSGYKSFRRFALSSLVHAALNMTDAEVWEIGGRERDYYGSATPNSTGESQ